MGIIPTDIYWNILELKDWTLHLLATESGLCCITLPGETQDALEYWVAKHIPQGRLIRDESGLTPYQQQLTEYFAGVRREFDMPLDLRGTPFQTAVWRALLQIPYGETRSYSDIATAIGRATAVRAVGAANGANPIPFVIPCHRVIGKNGTLTGYRGGIDIKAKLLRLEGIQSAELSESAV